MWVEMVLIVVSKTLQNWRSKIVLGIYGWQRTSNILQEKQSPNASWRCEISDYVRCM